MSDPEYRHAAALGSSFASGPGIEPIEDRAARRSARNYPHLLAENLGAALTDLTVAGATTATIIDTPQRSLPQKLPPQLDGLPDTADLVTITAGGNDLNYIGSMTRLAFAARLAGNALTRPLSSLMSRTGVPVPSRDDIELAAANLVRIVEAVSKRAAGARVVLVDYLTVIGEHTTTEVNPQSRVDRPYPAVQRFVRSHGTGTLGSRCRDESARQVVAPGDESLDARPQFFDPGRVPGAVEVKHVLGVLGAQLARFVREARSPIDVRGAVQLSLRPTVDSRSIKKVAGSGKSAFAGRPSALLTAWSAIQRPTPTLSRPTVEILGAK